MNEYVNLETWVNFLRSSVSPRRKAQAVVRRARSRGFELRQYLDDIESCYQ
jgi:hypothetical protein